MKAADIIAPIAMSIEAAIKEHGLKRNQFLGQIRRAVARCPRPEATTPAERVGHRVISTAVVYNSYAGDALRLLDDVEERLILTHRQVAVAEEFIQLEELA